MISDRVEVGGVAAALSRFRVEPVEFHTGQVSVVEGHEVLRRGLAAGGDASGAVVGGGDFFDLFARTSTTQPLRCTSTSSRHGPICHRSSNHIKRI